MNEEEKKHYEERKEYIANVAKHISKPKNNYDMFNLIKRLYDNGEHAARLASAGRPKMAEVIADESAAILNTIMEVLEDSDWHISNVIKVRALPDMYIECKKD